MDIESAKSQTEVLNWFVNFIGDANLHWLMVCVVIVIGMLLTAKYAHRRLSGNQMDPATLALIKAINPSSFEKQPLTNEDRDFLRHAFDRAFMAPGIGSKEALFIAVEEFEEHKRKQLVAK